MRLDYCWGIAKVCAIKITFGICLRFFSVKCLAIHTHGVMKTLRISKGSFQPKVIFNYQNHYSSHLLL
jgi:hypothetical protein